MADTRWDRLRTLFEQVRDLARTDRGAFLDRELGDDPGLRGELEALLDADDAAEGFLAEKHVPATGSTVGPYRLLEILGDGGFGVVYLAEQLHPIRRRVALKLIKPGMDTRQVIARFELERQALALMDHPGIAHVFDAGETEAARPYFAMEYVPGVPITVYCDREKLRIRQRLELSLQACDAVHHAHQKGVIHRDIKPSNVLVAPGDGAPVLKIIDFGIAKATRDAEFSGATMTREGTIIGTAGYMSPEQLGAITAPVDTRSDIYSLGALLYELLTGDSPFRRDRMQGASWLEVLQLVVEDPIPPAVMASRSNTAEIAERRSTDSRTLIRALKGELAWITLRALEKEPDRRYSSASELAADIRRYLADEPVMAAAPDTLYRVRKYARRHRVGVTAAAFVLLAVVAGGIAAGVGFGRAVQAERVARREADSSRQVADFLVGLFHASSPGAAGDSMTVRQLLDEGAGRIEADTTADPHVRARLLGAISDSYLNIEEYGEGVRLTRAALAAVESARPRDDVEVARYLDKVANGLSMAGKPDSLLPLVDRAIALLKSSKRGDPDLLSMCLYRKARLAMNRGDLAATDSLIDEAIRIAESLPKPNPERLARMYSTRGTAASWRMELETAAASFERSLVYADSAGEKMRIVGIRGRLAGVYASMGKPEEALSQARQGVELARRIYPVTHRGIAEALSCLTDVLTRAERYPEAIATQQEAVSILRAKGNPGEQLAYELGILANLYFDVDSVETAIPLVTESIRISRLVFGLDHPRCGEALANLARYQLEAGRVAVADTLFRDAIGVLGRVDDRTIVLPLARRDYANLCLDIGRYAEADTLYARAEAALDSANAGTRPYFGECLVARARLRARQGKHEEAARLMVDGFRIRSEELPAEAPELADSWLAWAEVRGEAGDRVGAIEKLRAAVRCGATATDAARFPELAALRTTPGYPFDNSP